MSDNYVNAIILKNHYASTADFRSRSEDWERLAKSSIANWFVNELDDLEFRDVLDAGAGLGRFSEALAKARDVNITAIDLSPQMVEETRRAVSSLPGDHRFIQAALEDAPFEDGSFDLVLANLLLHHVDDIGAGFRKLAALARPGGHVVLLTAAFDWMSELNRLQDEALLRLGLPYDDVALKAPGTNRFCAANILRFQPDDLALVRNPFFDGTMTFPSEDAILNFYVRTIRYKNVASALPTNALSDVARSVIHERFGQAGALTVSSNLYLFLFQKL
jgi:2-polyprenyl-3-methyl-5-hydroxy-6-metoxy-1,4-benzoquinol methylase